MKRTAYFIICAVCTGGFISANAESLLQPVSFPKTFNDAPFIARMQVLADDLGYYETIYDKKGRCVSGCAYPGIKIEDEIAAVQRNTERANAAIVATHDSQNLAQTSPVYTYPVNVETGTTQKPTPHTQKPTTIGTNTSGEITRAPINAEIRITSDFGPRKRPTAGASELHKGVDISVPIGTPVYSTGDGVVEYIRDQGNQGGGKYIVIKHGDTNFRTAYFHLSNNHVLKVGDKVRAGDLIGYSGNSGVSTGPHLDYRIFYTDGGKKFDMSADATDPLWTKNMLNVQYRFANQGVKSCLHTSYNFCGKGAIPPETLPGEIK